MRTEEIAHYIGKYLLTDGPSIPETEIVVNEATVSLKTEAYTPQVGDKIYLFSQTNGVVTLTPFSV